MIRISTDQITFFLTRVNLRHSCHPWSILAGEAEEAG